MRALVQPLQSMLAATGRPTGLWRVEERGNDWRACRPQNVQCLRRRGAPSGVARVVDQTDCVRGRRPCAHALKSAHLFSLGLRNISPMTSRLNAALRAHGVSMTSTGLAATLLAGPFLALAAPGAAAWLSVAPGT